MTSHVPRSGSVPAITNDRRVNADQLVFGLVVLTVGILFTLDRIDVIEVGSFWRVWPLILVAMGLSSLLKPVKPGGHRDGMGMVLIGVWLFLNQLHVLTYRDSWPILIMCIGLLVIWNAMTKRPGSPAKTEN